MKTIFFLSIFIFSSCCSISQQMTLEEVEIIDTHIHFFDTSRKEGVMWPPKNNKALHVPTFPKHFAEIAKENNVKKAVVIQASNWVIDGQWNLDVTEKHSAFYPAVVCNLSTLGTKQFRTDIDALLKNPRIVGLRITHPPESRPFFTVEMLNDLKYIASKNLSLDILPFRFKFEDIIKIADEIPNLKIMISLFGKSDKEIKTIAARRNVYCKLTVPIQKNQDLLSSYLKLILHEFGENRMVFGSNWPGTKAEEYTLKKEFLFKFLQDARPSAVNKVFYKNAELFYKLKNGR